jgi:hypothetical protein
MNMTITAARYANADATSAVVETTGAGAVAVSSIDTPEDWAALHASGIAIAAYEAPAATVAVVSPRQIRLALLQMGLLAAATTWIQSADEATRIEWDYATELRRDHPMWSVAAAALGKTEADIDALFALAKTL